MEKSIVRESIRFSKPYFFGTVYLVQMLQNAFVELTMALPMYKRNKMATINITTPISRLCLFSFS